MDRWEPPSRRTAPAAAPRRVRATPPSVDQRGIWANALLASGSRAAIMGFLLLAWIGALPIDMLLVAAVTLMLGLFLVLAFSWSEGLPEWGTVWLMDFVILTLVTPIVVWNGFVAAGRAAMLPPEIRAYLVTFVAAFVVLALVTALAAWIARSMRPVAGVLLLPAVLQAPGLAATLGDYRDATVTIALATAYLVAIGATLAAWLVDVRLRLWLAPAAALIYMLGWMVLGPGVAPLGASPALVKALHPLLIILSLGLVVIVPVLGIVPLGRLARGATRPPRRRRPRRRAVPRDPEAEWDAVHWGADDEFDPETTTAPEPDPDPRADFMSRFPHQK